MVNLTPVQRNRRQPYDLVFYEEDGVTRQDLANCSIIMYFKTSPDDADAAAEFTKELGDGLTVEDEDQGEVRLVIDAADTEALDWSRRPAKIPLYFSTILTDAAGAEWALSDLSGVLPVKAG